MRERVMCGADQHQAIFAERDPLDIVRKRVFGGESEIGGAGQNRAGYVGAFAFLDVDRNAGMRGQKGSQRLRQIFRKPRCVGEEADGGLHTAGKGGQIAAHRLDIVEHDPGMIEQAFAGRRQFDAATAARQQRYAERVLQPLDPRTPRGQREMNLSRAVGNAAGLGYRDEELKVDQVETHGESLRSRHCGPTVTRMRAMTEEAFSLRRGRRLPP